MFVWWLSHDLTGVWGENAIEKCSFQHITSRGVCHHHEFYHSPLVKVVSVRFPHCKVPRHPSHALFFEVKSLSPTRTHRSTHYLWFFCKKLCISHLFIQSFAHVSMDLRAFNSYPLEVLSPISVRKVINEWVQVTVLSRQEDLGFNVECSIHGTRCTFSQRGRFEDDIY